MISPEAQAQLAHWGGTFTAALLAHWVSPHAKRAIADLQAGITKLQGQVAQLGARVGLLEKRAPGAVAAAELELAARPDAGET